MIRTLSMIFFVGFSIEYETFDPWEVENKGSSVIIAAFAIVIHIIVSLCGFFGCVMHSTYLDQ